MPLLREQLLWKSFLLATAAALESVDRFLGNLFVQSFGIFGSVPPLSFYLTDNVIQSSRAGWIVFVFMFLTFRNRAACIMWLPFVMAFEVFISPPLSPRTTYWFLLGLEMKSLNMLDVLATFPARIWFMFTNILLSNISLYFLDPDEFNFTWDPFYNLCPELSGVARQHGLAKPRVSSTRVETQKIFTSPQLPIENLSLPPAEAELIANVQVTSSFVPWMKIFLVCAVIVCLRMALGVRPGSTYASFPRESRGVLVAIVCYLSEIYLSTALQWSVYAFLWFMFFKSSRVGVADAEWAAISVAIWASGFSAMVAFTINSVANTLVHPAWRHMVHGSISSSDLRRQQLGLLFFASSYCILLVFGWIALGLFRFGVLVFSGMLPIFLAVSAYNRFKMKQPLDSGLEFTSRLEFAYSALAGTAPFRVLRLHPTFWTRTPIRCDMVTSSVDGFMYPYTAVSYKWDEDTTKETIWIDGRQFKVYPKVVSILRSMRSTFKFQYVWIDSVCIDQNNIPERNAQVQIMRQIYENASYVVGWLGGADYSGSNYPTTMINMFLAFTKGGTIEHRAISMIFRINSSKYLQDTSPRVSAQEFYQEHPQKLWEALLLLVRNPWFERVWIIQEVAMSRAVILRYGGLDFHWSKYANAMAVLAKYGLRDFLSAKAIAADSGRLIETHGIDNALVMENLRRLNGSGAFFVLNRDSFKLLSLENTLKLCLRFESKEYVDRIFGLLGVVSDNYRLGVEPSYITCDETKSIDDPENERRKKDHANVVFTDTTVRMIRANGTRPSNPFHVIRYAGIGFTRNLSGLPSWVPDWTAGLQTFILSHRIEHHNFRASLNLESNVLPIQSISLPKTTGIALQPISGPIANSNESFAKWQKPDVLRCDAVIFDKITRCFDIFNPSSDDLVNRGLFQRALKDITVVLKSVYPSGQSVTEAFWRTTLADSDSLGRPAGEEFLHAWQDYISELGSQADDHNREQGRRFFRSGHLTISSSQDKRFGHLLSSELSHSNPGIEEHFCSTLGPTFNFLYSAYNIPLFIFGRKLCLTEEGYIGLVPERSLEGDTICIFLGSETPHAIRSCGADGQGQNSGYQLVGECYIHGIMDGEVCKKPYQAQQIHLV